MAISFVGQGQAGTSSVTLPTGIQLGDIIVIWSYRNTTTAPTLVTGFTSIATGSANVNSYRLQYKVAVGTESSTSVTATNANVMQAVVYRGVWAVGTSAASTNASSTTTNIPTMTLQNTDGNSWVVAFASSKQTTSQSTTSGTTIRGTAQTGTTSIAVASDTNGGVASWAAHTSTAGAAATGAGAAVELIPLGALVQYKQQARATAANTQTAVWDNNTTTGNLIVVHIGNDSGAANNVASVTDSQSNTYTKIFSLSDTSFSALDLWYAYNITGGTTPTVTVTFTTGNAFKGGINLLEFSGFGTSDPLDKSASAATTGTLAPSSGATATTTQASEVVVGVGSSSDSSNVWSAGAGLSFYPAKTLKVGTALDMGVMYKSVSATAAMTATFSTTISSDSAAGVATFKTGAAGTVLTKTQTATARIANNVTKTQTATARIERILTKTQPATARIANIRTKTQPSVARIANVSTKTQTAVARIQKTVTKTQPATARIANTLTKTQSATARISVGNVLTKTQGATARISNTLTKTQPATARIAKTLTKTQPAVARIAVIQTKTQPATARIAKSVTLTQPAVSRIAKNLTKTQPATARIANVRTKTQTATASLTQTINSTRMFLEFF